MPYNPGIQDISGQLLAQGMQARAQGIAGGVTTLFQGLQQNQMMTNQAIARFQAASAANPKLLDFLNKAGTDQSPIPVNPDVLKAYADIKSGKTNVQNTALLAQFADSYNQAQAAQQMQELRQAQIQSIASQDALRKAQASKLQTELDQMKRLGELYAGFAKDEPKAEGVNGAPSQLQRGTGEMSLMGLTRQAPSGQSVGAQPMAGAQSFDFSMPQQSQMVPTSVQGAAGGRQPAPRRFTKVEPAPAEAAPVAASQAAVSRPAEDEYDVPPPPVPDWFKQEQTALGMDLKLSPEAKALAAKLREEYEASQPSEDGREPRRYISATEDTKPPRRKTIKLDAEGIKAILSNPRVLMESFPEVVREYISPTAAQRGFKGQRLDEVMRQEEQLRALQEMMRPSRRRR